MWPIKWYQSRHTLIRCDPLTPVVMETLNCFDLYDPMLNDDDDIQDASLWPIKCDPLTPVVMETLNCFDLHDPMLNDDDDIQDAYCKLYNF